jgi:hypothetical protein
VGAAGGPSEGRRKATVQRLRGWWRFAFGARCRIAEEAGFKMPVLHNYFPWEILLGAFVVAALAWRLSVTTSYDIHNYQYALSAELQSVAAIFALAVTGSLVALQIVAGTTPRILAYVPVREFVLAVVVNAVAMAFDVLTLLCLPDSAGGMDKFVINLAVVANGGAVSATMGYVWWAFHCTQPRIYLAALLNRMDQTDVPETQREIILAMEELGLHASERHHIQTCTEVNDALQAAAQVILASSSLDTSTVPRDVWRPLREIPETLGTLGAAHAERGLDAAVHPIAWTLGHLSANYCARDEVLVDVEFIMPILDIAESCGRHSRESALYNFLANKNRCLPWFAQRRAHESLRWWALNLEDEAGICAKYKFVDAGGEVVAQLNTLLDLAEGDQLRDHFYHGSVRTPVDWVAQIATLIDKVQSAFAVAGIGDLTPRFGDRPLHQSLEAVRGRVKMLRKRRP